MSSISLLFSNPVLHPYLSVLPCGVALQDLTQGSPGKEPGFMFCLMFSTGRKIWKQVIREEWCLSRTATFQN
jgi:hypothetical protein